MAAIIGEFISDPARSIHNMIANPPLQQHRHPLPHQHSHDASSSSYRPALRHRPSSSSSNNNNTTSSSTTPRPIPPPRQGSTSDKAAAPAVHDDNTASDRSSSTSSSRSGAYTTSGPAGRIPSPPSSSSPTRPAAPADNNVQESARMATSDIVDPVAAGLHTTASHGLQQPSPPSDAFSDLTPSTASRTTPPPAQTVVHVRDLAHIQTLAQSDMLAGGHASSGSVLNDAPLQQMKYDVSAMPINDIIEMVAALLTKITSTNDLQHDAMQRNAAHQQQFNNADHSPSGSSINPMSHSVLAFHGKNVPAITIHSYLARIHRYCPTTFEVFLSLLVYFDRMTERVNDLVTRSEEARRNATTSARPPLEQTPSTSSKPATDVTMKDDQSENSDESDSDLADDESDDEDDEMEGSASPPRRDTVKVITAPEQAASINGPSTYFVVDSFNIHRLIIAGVTCSSKFFSDVFYTNSRYAKVGGLPLQELNHLELQFLVLNDFRLAVPVEDLEAYATMLVEFYAREVVAQRT